MNQERPLRPRYGIDAPGLVRTMFVSGAAAALFAALLFLSPWPGAPWGGVLACLSVCAATYLIGMGCFMVYYSKVAKLRDRDRLLDLIPWSGAESVLDVGCGRGLMLVGAAKRLTTGQAVGIDLWQSQDQTGNRPEAASENARAEGVADRVEVRTADLRSLPFPDAAFDVVVSHWAVHNLSEPQDRRTALREIVRVLKPGGRLILADIQYHVEYTATASEFGLLDVTQFGFGWKTLLGAVVSFGSFRPVAVSARKPVD